jgi:tetratricopeptide (TPR) repeat protein
VGKRVLCTKNGEVFQVIEKPADTAVSGTFNFAPTRLIRDRSGYYYVLCEGSYYGMMVFTEKYEFCGFFGANSVASSLGAALTDFISGLFETEEKHAASVQALPYTMLDVCIDADGFITTINDEKWSGQIRRYGLSGTNILKKSSGFSYVSTNSFNFADNPPVYRDVTSTYGTYIYCAYNAITCDRDGFYYVVDGARGRIYVYDTDVNLLSVFGGGLNNGTQLGTFISPSAITVYGDDLLVSDFSTGKITVFRLTDYGKLLKQADSLTVDCQYTEAKPYWEQVFAQDRNCQLAYKGLAKAALEEGDYKKAMELSEQAFDQVTYAKAFEQVRDQFIHDNFWWILILCLIAVGALAAFLIISRRRTILIIRNRKLNLALSVLAHPIASFNEMKQKKLCSVPIAIVFLAIFFVTSVLKTMYGGFMYGRADLSQYNALIELVGTVGVVLLWTAANWLCCSLFQGKGDMKEIFCVSCYALMPVILFNIVYLVLSNFLVPTANSSFDIISTICYGLTVIHLLLGMTIVHDFSFFKSMAMAVLILLGMFVIAFVIFVMLSLSQNLLNFVVQIFNEVTMR